MKAKGEEEEKVHGGVFDAFLRDCNNSLLFLDPLRLSCNCCLLARTRTTASFWKDNFMSVQTLLIATCSKR